MAILQILQYPNETLREESLEVNDINDDVLKLIDDMVETMYDAYGIGLAAPQVGVLKRVIVVDVKESENDESKLYKLINPEIIQSSGSSKNEEGCLSIPEIREEVTRPSSVTVKALDETGKQIEIKADGLFATCLQHEIDHLNGILFIDHLSRLKKTIVKNKLKKITNAK